MSDGGITAIVLAGGRSSRFGRDKLAESIDGKTLLDHAIDGVRPLANEVVVVIAPGGMPPRRRDIRVVRDDAPFHGPLAGLLAGLRAAQQPDILVTAGDMPSLQPAVAEALLAALATSRAEAAVLEDEGHSRPIPMVIARDPGSAAAQRLIDAGERRLRALIDALVTTVIPEATWRALDPHGRSLRDIDAREDLR
jgi:molybdenum cofactor guanylyltransferase